MNRASPWRRRALPACVLAAATVTLLAACAPARATATPSRRSPTPNPGVASTIAFTITIPPGWTDVTGDPGVDAVHPGGQVLVVLQKPPAPPVVEGVNDVDGVIAITQMDQPLTASQVTQYLQSVRTNGATDVTEPLPATVGGSSGTSLTYASTQQGTPVQTEDIVVAHGGAMYEIQLITSRHAFAAQAHDLEQMLSHGWTWVRGD